MIIVGFEWLAKIKFLNGYVKLLFIDQEQIERERKGKFLGLKLIWERNQGRLRFIYNSETCLIMCLYVNYVCYYYRTLLMTINCSTFLFMLIVDKVWLLRWIDNTDNAIEIIIIKTLTMTLMMMIFRWERDGTYIMHTYTF